MPGVARWKQRVAFLNWYNEAMEIKFCRRCGAAVTPKSDTMYLCANGHRLYYGSQAAIGVFIVNNQSEVLLARRATEPRKGMLDTPGGFCDAGESLEETIIRELQEELHISPSEYSAPQFLCSGINKYEFDGETIRPLDVFFWARADKSLTVTPDDDVASVDWHPIATIHPEDFAFITQRQALTKLKAQLEIKTRSS